MPSVVSWPLLIRPDKISWLRFILEGYDGLAILSTLSAQQGLVRMQTLDCRYLETMRLVEALSASLSPIHHDSPQRPSYSHDEKSVY